MTLVIRELEHIDTRVLGALRCVDASTRAAVDAPLQIHIEGARVRRNRSGLYVITQADALAAHEAVFDAPPAAPAIGSVSLIASVRDLAGGYLPRLAAVALPRDPAPDHADQPASLFRPIEVAMYPGSNAPVGVNWAVLRANVRESGSGDALGGALLIARSGTTVLARGMSDWRGEAMVPVPGVPVTTWSDEDDDVVVNETAITLELIFDPAACVRTPAEAVRAGRAPDVPPLVDPDRLEAQRATLPHATLDLQIASGRAQSVSLSLALP